MRLVIQRVLHAEVQVDGNTIGKIGKGLLVLSEQVRTIQKKLQINIFANFSVFAFLKIKMVKPIYH